MNQEGFPVPKTATLVTIVLLIAAALGEAPHGADSRSKKPKTVNGHGGYPLTDTVTSMWGVIDEPASDTDKLLTFLIYFRGEPGWHAGKWSMNVRTGDEPAMIEFSKGLIVLHAEFSRKSSTLTLFRKDVPLDRSNVVLVDHVDHPGDEIVIELGKVNLRVPADANPAIHVVQHSESVRIALFGAAK